MINRLKKCLQDETPVPDAIHRSLRNHALQYIVVGGMPEVVNIFLETHDMGKVLREQRSLLAGYKDDMVKYAAEEDKPLIHQCFDSIPVQLSKDNKKFQYSVVKKGGRSSQFQGSLQWLIDAGIVRVTKHEVSSLCRYMLLAGHEVRHADKRHEWNCIFHRWQKDL